VILKSLNQGCNFEGRGEGRERGKPLSQRYRGCKLEG